jgi:hypothetical protein
MNYIFHVLIPESNTLDLSDQVDLRGKRVCVTIGEISERKTREQMGYLFAGIIETIAKETGADDRNQIKLWLYKECLQVESVNPFTSEVTYVTGRLSLCNRKETAQFIDRVIRRCADEGIDIPLPLWVGEIANERAE